MTPPAPAPPAGQNSTIDPAADPLITALELVRPVDAAVLCAGIAYREALIDQLAQEVEVLKVTRARILNTPAEGWGHD